MPHSTQLGVEGRREREVFRILPQLLDTTAAPAGPSIASNLPLSVHDPVLTALAQLAAFKLGVRRCLVSVFDQERQLVLAEATQESSLWSPASSQSSNKHNSQTWLGGKAIPRSYGICAHLLSRGSPAQNPAAPDGDLATSVVPDLVLDPRFSDRPYILQPPFNRFYAGVVLMTKSGVSIGVLSVYDDAPRPTGLDDKQLCFMRDLSRTVTRHLESQQPITTSRRGERMVRGLGSFYEGKASISRWNPDSSVESSTVGIEPHDNTDRCEQELHGPKQQARTTTERPQPVPLQFSASEPVSVAVKTLLPMTAPSRTVRTLSALQNSIYREASAIFGRAANIIRESVEVDGVVFLDASISSFGGLVPGQGVSSYMAERDVLSPGSNADSDENKPCHVLGISSDTHSSMDRDCVAVEFGVTESMLHLLLAKYPMGRVFSLNEDGSAEESSSNCSQDGGDCSVRSSNNSNSSGRSSRSSRRSTEDSSSYSAPTPDTVASIAAALDDAALDESARRHDYEIVAAMFPGARSVLLVPMWDARAEKWFAGSFLWTDSPARSFTVEGELSYLRAFAATIMAGVDRADALASERAKSVLLGSLSHELRSPLHGIVAAVELLHDTELNTFQAGLLQTMDYCGRTLLDVIDHLLDYSKINTLVKSNRVATGGDAGQSMAPVLPPPVELDALVEETVESVYSGLILAQAVQGMPASPAPGPADSDMTLPLRQPLVRSNSAHSSDSGLTWASDSTPDLIDPSTICVFIDCDPHAEWLCQVDAGALRRLIMNLVGNSLKYTTTGFVKVSIRQGQPQHGGGTPSSSSLSNHLLLKVTDSGRGIDPDFLRNRAFRPFSQEDVLSQGTGVGLSLVKDIVEVLHGYLHIESQLHHGTAVTVSIPMPEPVPGPRLPTPFWEHVRSLRGLRVSLQGFRAEAAAPGMTIDPSSPPPTELGIVTIICRDWLQLEIVTPDMTEIRPDLILCTETAASRLMAVTGISLPPVVAICDTATTARNYSLQFVHDNRVRVFETLFQPIGPRKLASALVLALGRYNKTPLSELIPSDPLLPLRLSNRALLDSLLSTEFLAGGEFPFMSDGSESHALPLAPPSLSPLLPSPPETPAGDGLARLVPMLVPVPVRTLDSMIITPPPQPSLSAAVANHVNGSARLAPANVSVGDKPDTLGFRDGFFRGEGVNPETKLEIGYSPYMSPALPLLRPQPEARGPPQDRYLLVDDNTINLRILVSFMKKLGHAHATATNGLEALEAYAAAATAAAGPPFTHVLMDISMPVMDGLEATRRIRQLERSSAALATTMKTTMTIKPGGGGGGEEDDDDDERLPLAAVIQRSRIIALTGLASAAAQHEAFASGVDVYLTKPVRFRDLSEVLLKS
ncbi:two-component system, sensor histidine kinase and response regulator [Microdochium nivale]|nr:two-component system, sensor histidine kinase and response regulator [Microdochium nivale]